MATKSTEKHATTPTPGKKPMLRQTRSGSRSKPVLSASSLNNKDTTPPKDASAKIEGSEETATNTSESPSSTSADGVQRNLSLEALFQVTHTELKNIKKDDHGDREKDTDSQDSESQSPSKDEANKNDQEHTQSRVSPVPVVSEVSIINESDLNQDGGEDITIGNQNELQIYVEVPQSPPDATVEVEMEGEEEAGSNAGESQAPGNVIKIPVSEKGIEKYHLKSDSLETQGLKLIYTKKSYDQYEPNPISYGTFKTRTYKTTIMEPAHQESTPGRKRKHPAKPGRHVCQYCGRGCAKPSVLEKHIRAHTGERPFPCIPCGFSFKTKSNLYKHCKSRAHAIKAGLSTSVEESSKDSIRSREESFGDEEMESDDMGETEEGILSDSSGRDMSSRSTSVETGDNSLPGGSFDSNKSLPREDYYISKTDTGEIVLSLDVTQQEELKEKAQNSPQLIRSSHLYRTDRKLLGAATGKGEHLKSAALSSLQDRNTPGAHIHTIAPLTPIDISSVTSTVQKEVDNSMKVTIKYPKITKQAAISGSHDEKYLSVERPLPLQSSFRRSASLPEQPAGVHRQSPSLSLDKDSKVVTAEALREKLQQLKCSQSKLPSGSKSLTKEMVGERINQLISDNAAVLALPMADAPRPKRMSRQNSEVKDPRDNPSVPKSLLNSSLSLDTSTISRDLYKAHGRAKSMEVRSVSVIQGQQNQADYFSRAEPTDQPPGDKVENEQQAKLAELMAAAKTATPAVVPTTMAMTPSQELNVDFKLAKSATTDASGGLVSTPTSHSVQNIQQLIAQPGVVLPQHSPGLLTRQLSLPAFQNAGSQSSIIRELLLKGHQEERTIGVRSDANVIDTAPTFQMVEVRPDGSTTVINDLTQVVVLDSKGTPTTAYMAPTAQDPVALNVAQDVEIVATGSAPVKKSNLKRTMSLPQGIPSASESSSPYGSVIFDNYDPKVPPKRGRPKGSKNRMREQLSLTLPTNLSSSPSTPEIYTSSMKMPLISTPISSQILLGSIPSPSIPTTSRPPLKLTIPPPLGSLMSSGGSVIGTGTPPLSSGLLSSSLDTPSTPSLTKLKLKGKLLMKRSISVERMLSQEREKQGSSDEASQGTPVKGISTPAVFDRSGSNLTPTTQGMLVRAASADHLSPLQKRRAAFQHTHSEDSPIRRLLAQQSVDTPSLHSASTDKLLVDASGVPLSTPVIMACSTSKPGLSLATSQDLPELQEMHKRPPLIRQTSVSIPAKSASSKWSPLAIVVSTTPTIIVNRGTAPTNQYQPINRQVLPFMAPWSQLGRQDFESLPQSVYLSLKLSPAAKAILSRTSSGEKGTDSPVLKDFVDSKQLLPIIIQATDKSDVTKNAEGLSEPSQKLKELENVVPSTAKQPDLIKKLSDNEGSTESDSPTLPNKSLSEKAMSQLLLMGHRCPMLRMHTNVTFCTNAKPQPMYVTQESGKKLSMYSNWQSAQYNPNPLGLSSRELMSLHHLRLHDNDPWYTSPNMGPSKTGVLTHSSYWNFYNKTKTQGDSNDDVKGEDEIKVIKQVPEVKMATGIKIAEEEPDNMIQVCTPSIAMETTVVTTPTVPKTKIKEPRRLKIFAGGYKTNEDYVYIRGRGRGKYVCEECGIRCKKPSMLRKHIRTHTDVRPYICQYCKFSFKTKGNLTKHMKSKAHQKKCTELGIVPVPTSVEESQIDSHALALQVQMAREGRVPSEDDDGQDEDDEDEGEEEEEEEDDEETVMLIDAATGETRETIRYRVVREAPDGPYYVVINDGNSKSATLTRIETTAQAAILEHIKQLSQHNISFTSMDDSRDGEQDDQDNQPRPSIDKEIAHSLLDLSKGSEPKKSGKGSISLETRRLLRQHSSHSSEELKKDKEGQEENDPNNEGKRLDSLIGALTTRAKSLEYTKQITLSHTAEVGKGSHGNLPHVPGGLYHQSLTKTSVNLTASDLQHIHKRNPNTYAEKIAALQSANENDMKLTMDRSKIQATGSGFVPPVLKREESSEKQVSLGARPNKSLLQRQTSVGGFDEDKPEARREDKPMNLSIEKESDLEMIETSTIQTQEVNSLNNQSVFQGGNNSLPEVAPNKNFELPALYKDGKYICPVCDKIFAEYSQYAYHKNIHYIEKRFKCVDCSLSFRTNSALQKHQRSELHLNKQNVNQQFGVTKDNPRPFKCDECNIAFRVHGHLAKHLRSKIHIQTMERLGKSVSETSIGSDVELIEEEPMEVDDDENLNQSSGQNMNEPKSQSATTGSQRGIVNTDNTIEKEAGSFQYHKHSDYEKDFSASNENVTVEKIKMEPIDLGAISSFGTQPDAEAEVISEKVGEAADKAARNREVFRHQASTGSTEQHPHKCGICGRTFKAITTLKQHLVTHAELRPYVCEYCDAGFTTAQSLKFHLRTHTQGRPYICGQCGETFARSEDLRNHMHSHEEDSQPQSVSNLKAANRTANEKSPVVSVPSPTSMPLPTVSTPTVYQTIKPKPSQLKLLRASQGQLIRSNSVDPGFSVLPDISTKQNDSGTDVKKSRETAAQRRLNFTSSLSLPIQSGNMVQLVPVVQDSQGLTPQPIGVMKMPMMGLPLQSQGLNSPLPTVLTSSSANVQALLLQGSAAGLPMILPSMPIIQVPTAKISTAGTKGLHNPSSISTPKNLAMGTHDDLVDESSSDPVLIPTVVLEKEEEDITKPLGLVDTTDLTSEEAKYEPGEVPEYLLSEQNQNILINNKNVDEIANEDGIPPEVISDASLSDVIQEDAAPNDSLSCDNSDAASGPTAVTSLSEDLNSGATIEESSSRILATKLIPGDDHAQEELVNLIEQQGLSLDKVQVLQVKDSEESTQFVIIESDDNDKVDAHAIAELVNQHKRSKQSHHVDQDGLQCGEGKEKKCSIDMVEQNSTGTDFKLEEIEGISAIKEEKSMDPIEGVSPKDVECTSRLIEEKRGTDETVKDKARSAEILTSANTEADSEEPCSSLSIKESFSARQRGMLKRQHSIDLGDQSGNSNKNVSKANEPSSKVRVTENSKGECIPEPVSTVE